MMCNLACSAFVEGRVPGRRVLKAGQVGAVSDDAAVERSEVSTFYC